MGLEKQVVSLELAKELQKLGVQQEGVFTWAVGGDKCEDKWTVLLTDDGSWSAEDIVPTYTVAELGEMLPAQYVSGRYGKTWYCWRDGDGDLLVEKSDENEANARAKMLIWLIQNKLITL